MKERRDKGKWESIPFFFVLLSSIFRLFLPKPPGQPRPPRASADFWPAPGTSRLKIKHFTEILKTELTLNHSSDLREVRLQGLLGLVAQFLVAERVL